MVRGKKKHGKLHYDYRNHVKVDRQHKIIWCYTITFAAVMTARVLRNYRTIRAAARSYGLTWHIVQQRRSRN